MASSLTVDLTDPALREAFVNCEVGREETLPGVTIRPISITDTELRADVIGAEPPEGYGEAGEETPAPPAMSRGKTAGGSNLPAGMRMTGGARA